MCLIAGMFGATAAAAASAQAVTGLAISAVSAAAGIAQSQSQFNAQQETQRRQMDLQYRNAQRQAYFEREQQVRKYTSDVSAHKQATLAYQQQLHNNNEAANKVYMAEQVKLQEASDRAAFKSQEIYAKSIGAMGTVLASGATGQSVGLMVSDTERQAGFGLAEQAASIRSAERASDVAMQVGFDKASSENNLALSKLPAAPSHPLFAPDPVGEGTNLGLGIPAYNWG